MDERTVYLYARHNGLGDGNATEFVTWFFDNRQAAVELGQQPMELTEAFAMWDGVRNA